MAESPQSGPSVAANPDPPAATHDRRPSVIYVMGAGHSGSTILGITLGNCSGIFFAGELARWLRWSGKSPVPGSDRAEFWSAVRRDVTPDLSGPEARSLEQSSALFRLRTLGAQHRLRGRYRHVTEELYRATARVAGATHIVDTSHFPRRARELQALSGIELYLVFLVRNPQSVVASYGVKGVRHKQTWNMPTTNAYLWLTYGLSLLVFLRHPRERRLFVRHEAFVANPEAVVKDILKCADSPAGVPDLAALSTGLPFQGNRVVRTEVVALNRRPEQPPQGSRITDLVHLPWRAVFSRLQPAATTSPASTADSLTTVAN